MSSITQDPVALVGNFNYLPLIVTVTAVTFGVATIFVILRLISRIKIARNVAADDWLIIVSWTLALGLNIVAWVAVKDGFGASRSVSAHVEQLTGDLFAFSILYVSTQTSSIKAILTSSSQTVGHALPKFSVLAYYLSISRTSLVFRNSVNDSLVANLASNMLINVPRSSP